jgi:hypothetical protein
MTCVRSLTRQRPRRVFQVPMIISDFNEEAAMRAQSIVVHQGLHATDVYLNPFRRPMPRLAADNLLPSCSNAFVFCAL